MNSLKASILLRRLKTVFETSSLRYSHTKRHSKAIAMVSHYCHQAKFILHLKNYTCNLGLAHRILSASNEVLPNKAT